MSSLKNDDIVSPVLKYQAAEHFEGGLKSENSQMRTLNSDCPVGLGRMLLKKGGVTPFDQHPVKESWLVANGEGELEFKESSTLKIQTGDIVVFDSNESHLLKNTGDSDLLMFSIWWD